MTNSSQKSLQSMSVVAVSGVVMEAVIVMVLKCKKKVSRAARKLREHPSTVKAVHRIRNAPAMTRRLTMTPFVSSKKKGEGHKSGDEIEKEEEEEGKEVWQRTILMGEKCQPLDFSGAIFYDSKGRQLGEYPTPRGSPGASPRAVSGSQPFDLRSEKMTATEGKPFR